MPANICRTQLAPLVAEALRVERRGHPTSIISDIAEETHAGDGIPDAAPTPLPGWADKAMNVLSLGTVKNVRDLPLLRSIQDQLLNNKSPRIRALSHRMFREDVGGTQANTVPTETLIVTERARLQTEVMKQLPTFYAKWVARKGLKANEDTYKEFSEKVTFALRRGAESPEEEVQAFAQFARKNGYDRALVRGKEVGTFDEDIIADENWINRMYKGDKFREETAAGNITKLDEVFANGIRPGLRKAGIVIDEARLMRLARGMVQNITDRADGIHLGSQYGLPTDNLDKLRILLRDFEGAEGGLDRADADYIVAQLTKRQSGEKAAIGSAKGRVHIDETATSNDGTLKFEDLLENDFRVLFPVYTDRVGADIAMRQSLGVSATEGGIMKIVNEVLADSDKATAKLVEKGLRDMAGLRSSLHNPDGLWERGSSAATNLSYATFGWMFGAASLAETGGMVAKAGTLTMLKHIPEMNKLRLDAIDGKFADELVEHLTNYTNLGMETIIHPMRKRAAKWDAVREDFVNARTGIERFLEKARDVTVKGSGIRWITDKQRLETSKIVVSEIERVMLRGGKLEGAQALRMAQMGYDEAGLKALHADMNKFGVDVEGMGGIVTSRADLERWAAESPQIHARFVQAVLRETERTIIEVSAGHLPYWMTTPIGRVMSQFLSFTTKAYNVHLLRGANLRDFQTLQNVVYSSMIASLTYYGRTSIQYAHDPVERARRLTPGNVALAGVARSSAGGLPAMFADNVASAFGIPGPFSNSRYSGLDTKLFSADAAPAVSVVNNTFNVGTDLLQVLIGKKTPTGDDLDRIMRLTPLVLLPSLRRAIETTAIDALGLPDDDLR
jgi:hypothetical protein